MLCFSTYLKGRWDWVLLFLHQNLGSTITLLRFFLIHLYFLNSKFLSWWSFHILCGVNISNVMGKVKTGKFLQFWCALHSELKIGCRWTLSNPLGDALWSNVNSSIVPNPWNLGTDLFYFHADEWEFSFLFSGSRIWFSWVDQHNNSYTQIRRDFSDEFIFKTHFAVIM